MESTTHLRRQDVSLSDAGAVIPSSEYAMRLVGEYAVEYIHGPEERGILTLRPAGSQSHRLTLYADRASFLRLFRAAVAVVEEGHAG